MATATKALKTRAKQVKDEKTTAANSAERIGKLFEDLLVSSVMAWDSTNDYEANQYVVYDGVLCRSTQATGAGESPDTHPVKWERKIIVNVNQITANAPKLPVATPTLVQYLDQRFKNLAEGEDGPSGDVPYANSERPGIVKEGQEGDFEDLLNPAKPDEQKNKPNVYVTPALLINMLEVLFGNGGLDATLKRGNDSDEELTAGKVKRHGFETGEFTHLIGAFRTGTNKAVWNEVLVPKSAIDGSSGGSQAPSAIVIPGQASLVGRAINPYTHALSVGAVNYDVAGLPPGINYTSSTRTFTGTATAAGTYTVTLTAYSINGVPTKVTFTWIVTVAPVTTHIDEIYFWRNPDGNLSIAVDGEGGTNGMQVSLEGTGPTAGVWTNTSFRDMTADEGGYTNPPLLTRSVKYGSLFLNVPYGTYNVSVQLKPGGAIVTKPINYSSGNTSGRVYPSTLNLFLNKGVVAQSGAPTGINNGSFDSEFWSYGTILGNIHSQDPVLPAVVEKIVVHTDNTQNLAGAWIITAPGGVTSKDQSLEQNLNATGVKAVQLPAEVTEQAYSLPWDSKPYSYILIQKGNDSIVTGKEIEVFGYYQKINTAPKLVGSIPEIVVEEGGSGQINIAQYFIDDDPLTFRGTLGTNNMTLPSWISVSSSGGILSWVEVPYQGASTENQTSYTFNLFAQDPYLAEGTGKVVFTVKKKGAVPPSLRWFSFHPDVNTKALTPMIDLNGNDTVSVRVKRISGTAEEQQYDQTKGVGSGTYTSETEGRTYNRQGDFFTGLVIGATYNITVKVGNDSATFTSTFPTTNTDVKLYNASETGTINSLAIDTTLLNQQHKWTLQAEASSPVQFRVVNADSGYDSGWLDGTKATGETYYKYANSGVLPDGNYVGYVRLANGTGTPRTLSFTVDTKILRIGIAPGSVVNGKARSIWLLVDASPATAKIEATWYNASPAGTFYLLGSGTWQGGYTHGSGSVGGAADADFDTVREFKFRIKDKANSTITVNYGRQGEAAGQIRQVYPDSTTTPPVASDNPTILRTYTAPLNGQTTRFIDVQSTQGVVTKREGIANSSVFDTVVDLPSSVTKTPTTFGFVNKPAYTFSQVKGRPNRLQSYVRTPADNFMFSTDTRFVGSYNEPVEELKKRGHSHLNLLQLSESDRTQLPANTPLRMVYEVGKDNFPGINNPVEFLLAPLENLLSTYTNTLPYINSTPENGRPTGSTSGIVDYINFNIEPEYMVVESWSRFSEAQKDQTFYNWATKSNTTARTISNNGQNMGPLIEAWNQKYRNAIHGSIQIQKQKAPGAKVCLADMRPVGIMLVDTTMDKTVNGQFKSYSASDLLTLPFDAQNAFVWDEINSTVNAGQMTVNGFNINISGEYYAGFDFFYEYTYDLRVYMTQANWNTYTSITDPNDPRANAEYCEMFGRPDYTGVYNHAMSYKVFKSALARKGWQDKLIFKYFENIYEEDATIIETGQRADSRYQFIVSQTPPNASEDVRHKYGQKYFLHLSRLRSILAISWMRIDGFKLWDVFKQYNVDSGDPRYRLSFLRTFDELQSFKDQLDSFGVRNSGSGVTLLSDSIPIWNENTSTFVQGHPEFLYRQKRVDNRWQHQNAVPLVEGKKDGNRELYFLHAPLEQGETKLVRWKTTTGAVLEVTLTYATNGMWFCYDPTLGNGQVVTPPTTTPSNQNPSVNITAPLNGAIIAPNTNFEFKADASDPDGSVTKVELLVNGIVYTTDTTWPYGTTLSLPTGSYELTARVTDNNGAVITSTSKNVTVQNQGSSGGSGGSSSTVKKRLVFSTWHEMQDLSTTTLNSLLSAGQNAVRLSIPCKWVVGNDNWYTHPDNLASVAAQHNVPLLIAFPLIFDYYGMPSWLSESQCERFSDGSFHDVDRTLSKVWFWKWKRGEYDQNNPLWHIENKHIRPALNRYKNQTLMAWVLLQGTKELHFSTKDAGGRFTAFSGYEQAMHDEFKNYWAPAHGKSYTKMADPDFDLVQTFTNDGIGKDTNLFRNETLQVVRDWFRSILRSISSTILDFVDVGTAWNAQTAIYGCSEIKSLAAGSGGIKQNLMPGDNRRMGADWITSIMDGNVYYGEEIDGSLRRNGKWYPSYAYDDSQVIPSATLDANMKAGLDCGINFLSLFIPGDVPETIRITQMLKDAGYIGSDTPTITRTQTINYNTSAIRKVNGSQMPQSLWNAAVSANSNNQNIRFKFNITEETSTVNT